MKKLKRLVQPKRVLVCLDLGYRVSTLEIRGWFPVVVLLFIFIWYVRTLSYVSAIGLAGLGGILALAYTWSRAMLHHVSGSRTLVFRAIQVGDEIQEIVELNNNSFFPVLWAEFIDSTDLPGYTIASVRGTDPHNFTRWRAGAICDRRGLFQLGPWELHTGDPFGIFKICHVFHEPEEILVLPPLAVLPSGLLPKGGSQGEHLIIPQPLSADTVHAAFVRPYVPGDPLRKIHWPTTARQPDLYVKGFEPEGTSTIWLILDLDRNVHFGAGPSSSEEAMITLAASLAREYLQSGLAVGLYTHADRPLIITPQRGMSQFWSLIRGLAPLHATSDQPLTKTIESASIALSPRHLSVVITPSLECEWPGKMSPYVRRGRGGVMAILLHSDDSRQTSDPETSAHELLKLGIRAHVVAPSSIKPIHASYGDLQRWDFVVYGTGQTIARSRPRASLERHMESLQ